MKNSQRVPSRSPVAFVIISTISQHEAVMSSRPPSKLKQLLVRDQLWWRYYLRNIDTIRQAVVDTICKVLACGRVIMGYPTSYAVTVNALTPKQSALAVKPCCVTPAARNSQISGLLTKKRYCRILNGSTSPLQCRIYSGNCSNSTALYWVNRAHWQQKAYRPLPVKKG